MSKQNGVFCLETDWTGDLRDRNTVKPSLDLVGDRMKLKRNAAPIYNKTEYREQLERQLKTWQLRKYANFSVLYLSFHGDSACIYCGDRRKPKNRVTLEELAELLEGKCKGKIIHFGSCCTLNVKKPVINRFLKQTHALAVSGYTNEIDWMRSAAFDMLVMSEFVEGNLNVNSARKMKKELQGEAGGLGRKLGFKMIVREARWQVKAESSA